ncbi:MAG: hypothetical protein AB1473_16850 [Thermodesulfobacteriota bacterium]
MESSELFRALMDLGHSDAQVRALTALVESVYSECLEVSKTIIRHFPEYTLHDYAHIRKVLEIEERLIPEATRNRLRPLEIAALMLAAILHDVGMAPSQDEVESLLGIRDHEQYRDEVGLGIMSD